MSTSRQKPRFHKAFVDASNVGIGSVLLQERQGSVDYPVVYMSKKLNAWEKNYSTIEKECLALVRGVEHFQVYFGSNPIIVYTDYNPLTFINKAKGMNQRILRWSFFLQQYNLTITHIAGREKLVEDALTRM